MALNVDGSPLGGDTVTVHRSVADMTDEYGNPISSDQTHDVTGCSFQPLVGSVTENNAPNAVTISVGWRLFAPYGSDIQDTDWIGFSGVLYDVEGGVTFFEPSDGFDGHMEMYLHKHGG